jgi:Tol biopolymer transport system component
VKTIVSPDEGEPLRLFGQHEWSPDGGTLYYGRLTNNFRNAQIISRDLESGEDKMIYESDEILHLTLSPDGHWLSVLSRPRSKARYTMQLIPVSGGETRELFRFEQRERIDIGFSGSSTWSTDGSHILFRLRDDNVEDPNWELCRIPASGGEIQKLGIIMPGENASSLSMHPDGSHIAFSSTSAPLPPAVWVIENFLPSD